MPQKNRYYGLIGKKIDYSFSKSYFKEKFERENLNHCFYNNYDLESINDFLKTIEENEISGLNVTIPYKESIINYLDDLDPSAKTIGAVNTIKIENKNFLKGYNTDYLGFIKSLKDNNFFHKKALILGTGGASKAIIYALKSLNTKTTVVSRKRKENCIIYRYLNKDIILKNTLIINCTPLGTFPKIEEYPKIPYEFITKKHLCYDLIYNPNKTKFLEKSEIRGASIINGLQMLENQAKESWKIWNS